MPLVDDVGGHTGFTHGDDSSSVEFRSINGCWDFTYRFRPGSCCS